MEALIRPGPYAFGPRVTVADICLVPQVYNARRFKVPLDRFPGIVAVDAALQKLPAFDAARPECSRTQNNVVITTVILQGEFTAQPAACRRGWSRAFGPLERGGFEPN